MSNEENGNLSQPKSGQSKPARKVRRELPKFLQDGGFVMIFGAKRPPDVPTKVIPDSPESPPMSTRSS